MIGSSQVYRIRLANLSIDPSSNPGNSLKTQRMNSLIEAEFQAV